MTSMDDEIRSNNYEFEFSAEKSFDAQAEKAFEAVSATSEILAITTSPKINTTLCAPFRLEALDIISTGA